jgi:cytochrome c oxidase assembly factor CtaG
LAGPVSASVAYAAAIWGAHVPAVYQAALLGPGAHLLLLGLLLAASVWFWVVLVAAPPLGRVLMAFIAMVHTGLLGALLTLSPEPWYPVFGGGPARFGLGALADQQLAGLIMWVPMAGAFAAVALASVGLVLGRPEGGNAPLAAASPSGRR